LANRVPYLLAVVYSAFALWDGLDTVALASVVFDLGLDLECSRLVNITGCLITLRRISHLCLACFVVMSILCQSPRLCAVQLTVSQ